VSAGAGEDLRHDVRVCLEEALANLILHAQPRDGDKHIRLRLTASSDGATLIVSDRCVPYDITDDIPRSAPRAPGEIRIGGNGVTLIRALAGRVQYSAEADGNDLRLEFGVDAKRSLIRSIPALRNVPQDALDALLADAGDCSFAAGDTLLKQGEAGAFALILLTGEVTIINESAHGDVPLRVIAAPALIGEIGALSQLRRTAGARANTDITALEIPRESMLLVAQHELLLAVIAQTGEQIENLSTALGLYAAGLAALERDDLDAAILADLTNPTPELSNFAEAFQRLAHRVTLERRSRAELASAALIQRAMLPAPIEAKRLAGRCTAFGTVKPAREVGGDLFDLTLLSEDRLVLVVGDVCGKGVPASLFMSATVTALRLAAAHERDLSRLIAQANDALCAQNAMAMFATVFYGVLDLDRGRLDYVVCGHSPPIHLSAAGGCAELTGSGPPLGFFPERVWRAHSLQLAPGDGLFLFTDGVTECLDPANEEYGDERLKALLRHTERSSAEHLVQAVMADVDAFADRAEQTDDITCVAVVLA
jgi:serine phosphatase RsbU (regulator of sigma subunit)/anti-sigma regulatory factor (Ser/Thr protein kinase)